MKEDGRLKSEYRKQKTTKAGFNIGPAFFVEIFRANPLIAK